LPADTRPEIAEQERAWWEGLDGESRLEWWSRRQSLFARNRYNLLARRNPGASDAELMALWVEETYRGTVDPGFLARACAAIRARGDGSG
jgi:hypothetical protein